MRIVQIGFYPPPFGGVSIHIKRLLEYLGEKGRDCLLIDLSGPPKKNGRVVCMSFGRAVFRLLFARKSIIHFHNFSLKNTLFYFILSFRHATILSLHNERFTEELDSKGPLFRTLGTLFLNRMDFLIVDNNKCRKLALDFMRNPERVVLIPEFIPPAKVPPLENQSALEMRRRVRYLLASNAFRIAFHRGEDLYGLDLLVEMLDRLVNQDHLDVGVVFLLPNIGDESYFQKINSRLAARSLDSRFHFITTPVEEASSLWQVSDLVIRATNTDGNSLTILEALSLNVPVLASDCVDRPDGTMLFKNRDVDSLCERVRKILLEKEAGSRPIMEKPVENNGEKFVKLYEEAERGVRR